MDKWSILWGGPLRVSCQMVILFVIRFHQFKLTSLTLSVWVLHCNAYLSPWSSPLQKLQRICFRLCCNVQTLFDNSKTKVGICFVWRHRVPTSEITKTHHMAVYLPCFPRWKQICISLCFKCSKCGLVLWLYGYFWLNRTGVFGSFGQFHWNANVGKIVHWDSNSRAEHDD